MIDTFSLIGLVLSILIVGCFFLLIIIQINSYNNKKVENLYLIIALSTGLIALCAYIFDLIIWESNLCSVNLTNSCIYTRANLDGLLFFFDTICFYFWFKHYQKIILLGTNKYSINIKFLKKFKMFSNNQFSLSEIDILFIIGIFFNSIFYLGYFFNLGGIFSPFWQLMNLPNNAGRFVTFISHVSFSGGIIFLYITYIIVKNNLIELGKVTIYELFSITVLGFSCVLLLLNDIFITYNLYSNELNVLFVNIGLLTVFISLIILLIDYILLQPAHIQSPSLYKDIAELIKTIDDPNFAKSTHSKSTVQTTIFEDLNLETIRIPQKLNGTSIIILIYLMKNNNLSNILAKDLEENLKLNKSTISYNLRILESNEFIMRKTPIEQSVYDNSTEQELDQREKRIYVTQEGKNFLIQLQQYLNSVFN